MSSILYVGNLPFSMTPTELANLLKANGHNGAIKIIVDKETGMSKGYGFIKMTSETEAQVAMDKLKKVVLNGHSLHIKKVNPQLDSRSNPRPGQMGRIRCYRNEGTVSGIRY